MEKTKVYFTDFRTGLGVSLPDKLKKLIRLAGIGSIDMDGKLVAIKMHFGEMGNIAYLRPNYAKAVADVVKEQGGKPFLTDCNTLYPGYRKNAIDHLYCAEVNGFGWMTTGCPVIIGDGLRGTDDVEVPVRNGEYCRTAFIGKSVMDADVFISLAHRLQPRHRSVMTWGFPLLCCCILPAREPQPMPMFLSVPPKPVASWPLK